MNVIVVDDDLIIRTGLKKIIEKYHTSFRVLGDFSDGQKAFVYLSQHPEVDLMITDIKMPNMDGVALVKALRSANHPVKIVVLSGFNEFSYVRSTFKEGIVDYLLKPINRNEFSSLLEKIHDAYLTEQNQNSKEEPKVILDIFTQMAAEGIQNTEELYNSKLIPNTFSYTVSVFRMDKYYKRKLTLDEIECEFSKIQEVLFHELQGEQIKTFTNKTQFILIWFSAKEDKLDRLLEIYDKIKMDTLENIDISLGISKFHDKNFPLPTAYQESMDALDFIFYTEKRQCIMFSQIDGKIKSLEFDLNPWVSRFSTVVSEQKKEETIQTIEELFETLEFSSPLFFRDRIVACIEALCQTLMPFETAVFAFDIDFKFNIKEDISTYICLKAYVISLFLSCIDYLQNEKKNKTIKRVQLAQEFIQSNYMKTLSLAMVADYVQLNPSYFSNLFKEEVGENFSEYLLNIRMNNAMELLKDPTVKIYEISFIVGYEDVVSFGRAFKKKVGMSPKEYRNTVY